MKMTFDWKEYIKTVRLAAAEGCVLLKNDNECLPVKKGEKVAVFGRTQFDYIKSGTGSGGMVNTPYVVNFYDGFKACGTFTMDESIADIYRAWLKDHPFDKGVGWAQEPWSQDEMEVSDELAKKAALNNDAAIVVIGRLAGEDKDNKNEQGSYLLRDDERALISVVTKNFKRTCVLINSGNIIDMKWVNEYNPAAVLYVWQGGCEGGNAAADVITGAVNPSGRLVDTIAYDIEDYPAYGNFGDPNIAIYKEDIYVGYRYFESFKKDRVMYPFGFGLSYTTFSHDSVLSFDGDKVTVSVTVTNTGKCAGKEVAEVYFEAPQGKLGKAKRELIGFAKTGIINPGESTNVNVEFLASDMAAYDDEGVTGTRFAFVLEAGEYAVYEGKNVREASKIGSVSVNETVVTKKTTDALAPMTAFDKMVSDASGNLCYKPVALREKSPYDHILEERKKLKEIPYKGAQRHNFKEVKEGKISLDEFIAGLSDKEMIQMTRGEGMSSPRVTAGTAAAFAGVTDDLQSYGIPAVCCTDGPSGLRMDSGANAMQGPNGVCLACTFDTDIVEKVYDLMGIELRYNNIDSLLGPGMNIHRHPLNGRNFEYFSEDPFVTGKMAVAELKGLHKHKVTGTIKHFACNNQEIGRHTVDSIVSARALREIYLKGYEMAVREAGAYNIMTTYGILNGTHTASNFDLNILLLHDDWGYEGLTETDWWTMINDEGGESDRNFTGFMIRGGNDLYMVSKDSTENGNGDNSYEALENGTFTRAELQRNVRHILTVALRTAAFDHMHGEKEEWEVLNKPVGVTGEPDSEISVNVNKVADIPVDKLVLTKGARNMIYVNTQSDGEYRIVMEVAANGTGVEQSSMTLLLNNTIKKVITRSGAEHDFREEVLNLEAFMSRHHIVTFAVNQAGLVIKSARVEQY